MLTANEVNTLKAKVKAEMLRRNGYGSISEFGSANYDFSIAPSAGNAILTEHGQKTIDLLLKIKPISGLSNVQYGATIPPAFNSNLISYIDTLAKESMTSTSSSCSGLCTGLCVSQCSSGCTGTCGGTGCGSGCWSQCGGSCTASCANDCWVQCASSCGTACGGGCADYCAQCSGGCGNTCYGSCTTTCGGSCLAGGGSVKP